MRNAVVARYTQECTLHTGALKSRSWRHRYKYKHRWRQTDTATDRDKEWNVSASAQISILSMQSGCLRAPSVQKACEHPLFRGASTTITMHHLSHPCWQIKQQLCKYHSCVTPRPAEAKAVGGLSKEPELLSLVYSILHAQSQTLTRLFSVP